MALLTCLLVGKRFTRTLRNHGTVVTEISILPSSAGPAQYRHVLSIVSLSSLVCNMFEDSCSVSPAAEQDSVWLQYLHCLAGTGQ